MSRRIRQLEKELEEEQNKPKIMSVDLSKQVDPEVTDFCSFIASIVDKIVSEDNSMKSEVEKRETEKN